MKLILRNTPISVIATLLICISSIKYVHGKPMNIYKNDQQPGIYSENSWNNNENENPPRNTWVIDLNNNNNNNRKEDTGDECNKGVDGQCGDQEIVQSVLRTPIKKDMSPLNGWGAGGMPFNILYMKNPKPAKSLRPQSAMYGMGIIAEPLRSQPITGPQAQLQYQTPRGSEDIPLARNIEMIPRNISLPNGVMPIRNGRPKGRSSNSSLYIPSRRHYSIIPQLFVSYGWGPTAK